MKCHKCKKIIEKRVSLLLSPPDEMGMFRQFPLCVYCYDEVLAWMLRSQENESARLDAVAVARDKEICRICGEPYAPPFTYDFGREYAHTKCLEVKQ